MHWYFMFFKSVLFENFLITGLQFINCVVSK